jgi:PilZ domain-containing protein
MPEAATFEKERRSSRVFKRVRVQAAGKTKEGRKFRETCETIVINAHGGLFCLTHEVAQGEMLVLTNSFTQEELECRVVFLGDASEKGQRVGVEFLSPSPHFWGVEFAQVDWQGSSPEVPPA